MKNTVLILVAHPDDETISMAGTICKHVKNGDKVYAVSMTDGVGARNEKDKKKVNERENSKKKASKLLGFTWGKCYNFKDNCMDSYPLLKIIKTIEKVKQIYKPTIVYTHSAADLNIDHRVLVNAVLTAFRPTPMEACKEIRLFEVASSTDYGITSVTSKFDPNLFINIKDEWNLKLNALNCYYKEMREYPHSRSLVSIKNLAKLRGNQVGYEFAEAFQIIRKLGD